MPGFYPCPGRRMGTRGLEQGGVLGTQMPGFCPTHGREQGSRMFGQATPGNLSAWGLSQLYEGSGVLVD